MNVDLKDIEASNKNKVFVYCPTCDWKGFASDVEFLFITETLCMECGYDLLKYVKPSLKN